MLKRRLCELSFEWTLSCEGPLLIADGRYEKASLGLDKEARVKVPDKVFINHSPFDAMKRAVLHDPTGERLNLDFYVPGTSLRGPFRAQAERIVRSLRPDPAPDAPAEHRPPHTACDPFENREGQPLLSCSKRLESGNGQSPYARACPICKLFGCTATASRIRFSDADVTAYRSAYRDMIGIDRFTGGVYQGEITDEGKKTGGANVRVHVLEGASFSTTVTVTNFELWQVGLLAYVLRDFEAGLVPIGFGKTKGFGQVRTVEPKKLVVQAAYPVGRSVDGFAHLWSLAPEARGTYGLFPSEQDLRCGLVPNSEDGLALLESYSVTALDDLWSAAAQAFNAYVASLGQQLPAEGE